MTEPIHGEPRGGMTPVNQVKEQEPKSEVAPVEADVTQPEGTDESEVKASPAKEVEESGNWWDTTGLDDKAAKRIKTIQTEFQKKSEEAKRAKELESKAMQYESQIAQITEEVKQAMADPEVYRKYRRQLGYENEIPSSQPVSTPPEFKLENIHTIQDLQNAISNHIKSVNQHWEQKLNMELAKAQSKFETKVSAVAEPVAKERWETAVSKVTEKFGPKFVEKQAEVISKILNGAYRNLYGQTVDGKKIDEAALLEKVFIAEFPDEYYNSRKSKEIESIQKKSPSATIKPTKKGGSTTPTGNSKDDAIARIRQRFGS